MCRVVCKARSRKYLIGLSNLTGKREGFRCGLFSITRYKVRPTLSYSQYHQSRKSETKETFNTARKEGFIFSWLTGLTANDNWYILEFVKMWYKLIPLTQAIIIRVNNLKVIDTTMTFMYSHI